MLKEMSIQKPTKKHLKKIREILAQWNDKDQTDIYFTRIKNEIDGKKEFNMRFWIWFDRQVSGVIGLSDLSPDLNYLSETDNPGQLKILYVDNKERGKGIGKKLTKFIEGEAAKNGYKELLIKSSEIYKDTAWGFYEKMGYISVALVKNKSNNKKSRIFQKSLL